jgi:hypothetical protein
MSLDLDPHKMRIRNTVYLSTWFTTLKEQSNEIFYLRFFHWWTPLKPLTRFLKTFRIWLRIQWDIHDFLLTLLCNL